MAEACEGVSWVDKLKRYNEKHTVDKPKPTESEQEEEDEQLLGEYYIKFKNATDTDKYKLIPKFYSKPPADDEILQQKLREDARATFLQRRTTELMDNEELQKLWLLLEENPTPPDIGEEPMISFVDFQKIGEEVADKCKSYFTAGVFSKLLNNDPYGRISISQLFSYVMRKVWLQQTRIGLSLFDIQGLGYLKEVDLENYILELIPTLPQLKCLEESFYSFYVCTAVRKFFFFLDPMRTGKIKIQDILACGFLDDLLELSDLFLYTNTFVIAYGKAPILVHIKG